MQESENRHVYDLEERTFQFAKAVRLFIKKLPRTIANIEDAKQLVKSSGSTGANYIEANESLSPKDFLMRVKISRKEVKESAYWLRLIHETNEFDADDEIVSLMNEAGELLKILSAIINKHK
jgi:four helix bundle protein